MQNGKRNDITLAVLAGGAGTRMGGPKGSLIIQGRPILEYLLDCYAWTGPTMLVLAPDVDRPAGAERFSAVTSDPTAGLGPLQGILTALEQAMTQSALVTTVDMPGIAHAHLSWLSEQRSIHGVMTKHDGQVEPFPSLFRSSARPAIEQQLADQRRSVQGLLKLPGFIAIESPKDWRPDTWTNLNTPQDVMNFRTALDPSWRGRLARSLRLEPRLRGRDAHATVISAALNQFGIQHHLIVL